MFNICESKKENSLFSSKLANVYVELGFLKDTLNELMDLTKNQGEAITAILTHLKEKEGE